MSGSSRPKAGAAARFFHEYLSCLEKHSIPEEHRRWYVRRLEAIIKAQRGRKIKSLSGTEIDRYLEATGRQSVPLGWHFVSASMLYGFCTATYSHLRCAVR